MRFEPKLIPGEEPPLKADGEIDLPADFAALGEQLGDDARHLAACYPAGELPKHAPQVSRRLRKYAFGAAAAVAVAVTVTIVAVRPSWHRAPSATASNEMTTSDQSAVSTFIRAPVHTQAISLTDLSAPEIEALLDLADRQPHDAVRVAF